MQRKTIGLIGTLPPEHLEQLERRTGARVINAENSKVQVLVAWAQDVPKIVSGIEQRPDLEWVHVRWAGVPPVVLQALANRPAILTNGSGAFGLAVAEYVLALVLHHLKGFAAIQAAQRAAMWLPNHSFRELRGTTVGIVGLGDLGRSTARLLRACGVTLRGLRRSGRPCAEVDETFQVDDLDRFLEQLDVLVIAAPLTSDTEAMIGARELARLRRGALLVNVGRAQIVSEAAMLEALSCGQLSGAALDVFASEPLAADSLLWRTPNVFISPHCADATAQSRERSFQILLDNAARFMAGQPLRNIVDRELGY